MTGCCIQIVCSSTEGLGVGRRPDQDLSGDVIVAVIIIIIIIVVVVVIVVVIIITIITSTRKNPVAVDPADLTLSWVNNTLIYRKAWG
jgi:heme/copper-type cytochrome/quinol oxidase subunit 2